MTIDKVFSELERCFGGVGWHLDDSGVIRRGEFGGTDFHCPISALATAVSEYHVGMSDFGAFAKQLNLSSEDMLTLIDAADNNCRVDAKIRKKLLDACGLKE